jgi:succinoglycan biosynthesis protein ExoO
MAPRVSVIIAAYNTEGYVAQAIESVLSQTEPDLELIVVDDASQDATAEVVEGFSDGRLTLVRNEENRGVSRARNGGLDVASGEWIAWLDSDDWFAVDRLERLVEVGVQDEADMVADDLYFVRPPGDAVRGTFLEGEGIRLNQRGIVDPRGPRAWQALRTSFQRGWAVATAPQADLPRSARRSFCATRLQ